MTEQVKRTGEAAAGADGGLAESLYDQIGGAPAIRMALDRF